MLRSTGAHRDPDVRAGCCGISSEQSFHPLIRSAPTDVQEHCCLRVPRQRFSRRCLGQFDVIAGPRRSEIRSQTRQRFASSRFAGLKRGRSRRDHCAQRPRLGRGRDGIAVRRVGTKQPRRHPGRKARHATAATPTLSRCSGEPVKDRHGCLVPHDPGAVRRPGRSLRAIAGAGPRSRFHRPQTKTAPGLPAPSAVDPELAQRPAGGGAAPGGGVAPPCCCCIICCI